MNYPSIKGIRYYYKSVSVEHLDDLQEDFDSLNREGVLSNHETYRYYLSNKKFAIPETLPDAKSLIVLATSTRMMYANFHLQGRVYDIMIPPPYYDDGLLDEDLEDLVLNTIIQKPGYNIVKTRDQLHLKLLAVRSGLGTYGRNNICYIDGMGSFLTLHAYYTNYKMDSDSWHSLKMMDHCENCTFCIENCPTKAIRGDPFVIDASKCLPLYNEIDGEFPEWMDRSIHHSIMGCMKCQYLCPGNKEEIKRADRFEDVSEEETSMLLNGDFTEDLVSSLSFKIKMFDTSYGMEYLPRLKRNLELLVK
ncbi:MAG: epoxyqueuosine reductase [Candidatus Lokiarchaeota archaeon]|nr:epoxyqueuosine reductase [Candidatus Lokiarchaeota archaeon]